MISKFEPAATALVAWILNICVATGSLFSGACTSSLSLLQLEESEVLIEVITAHAVAIIWHEAFWLAQGVTPQHAERYTPYYFLSPVRLLDIILRRTRQSENKTTVYFAIA
jgi:hypothetical protein